MCAAGAHGPAIAHDIGISEETIYARCKQEQGQDFTSFRLHHYKRGDDILRVKQFQQAAKGDKALLIFLGKNRLGQRDRVDITGQVNYAAPVINITVQAPRTDGDPPTDPTDSGGG